MLRIFPVLRLSSLVSQNTRYVQNIAVRCKATNAHLPESTGPVTNLQQEKETNGDKRFPSWAQSSLDRDLCAATSTEALFSVLNNKSFNRRNAVNFLTVLSSWVATGKLRPEDVDAHKSSLESLFAIISKDNFNIGMPAILQSLKNLMLLGMNGESFVVTALQNELLWNLRKYSVRQLLQVLSFEKDYQESTTQKKIIDEVIHSVQRRWVEVMESKDFVSILNFSKFFEENFLAKLEDRMVELADSFPAVENAKVMIALGHSKRRPTPLLRSLAFHINKSKDVLPPKLLGDLLFAINKLSFHDTSLLEKLCNDLMSGLTEVQNAAIVGSILTSLGQLRYRHTGALEALCEWVDQNYNKCRVQDLVSTILCLAAVNFIPSNAEQLFSKLVTTLKRDSVSTSAIWLDVVWSLAALDQLPKELLVTVLQPNVIKELTEKDEAQAFSAKMKLSNLAALCRLSRDKYGGIAVQVPSPWSSTTVPESPALSRSVMDALANFVPPPKYLRENILTDFGVRIDGFCVLNGNCTPLPLAQHDVSQPLAANTFRIAVTVLDYKDLCLGSSHLTGISSFRQRLLTLASYKVVPVTYREFSPKDKLVKKVQFLEQSIKEAIGVLPSAAGR